MPLSHKGGCGIGEMIANAVPNAESERLDRQSVGHNHFGSCIPGKGADVAHFARTGRRCRSQRSQNQGRCHRTEELAERPVSRSMAKKRREWAGFLHEL